MKVRLQKSLTPLNQLLHSDSIHILTEAEKRILKILDDLYVNRVLEAEVHRTDDVAWLELIFDTRYVLVPSMHVNLTQFARRQQEEMLDDSQVRKTLTVGTPQDLIRKRIQ
ncbi:hypothetical protein [Gimesia panareensis]|nr:hypothetical protein [Gimesia panareensis]